MSLRARMAELGGNLISPAILMPASVPLELSGEDIRRRLCTFTDEEGQEWALRPDFTLPIALHEVAQRRVQAFDETLRQYAGSIFRLPSSEDDPIEYEQVGFERFGAPSTPQLDLWACQSVYIAAKASGLTGAFMMCGDLSIVPAFIDAFDLPSTLKADLKRAFRQEGGIEAYLNAQDAETSNQLVGRLSGMSQEDVAAFVDEIFRLTGVRPIGERTADEIVERLHDRSQASDTQTVPEDIRETLTRLLAIKGSLAETGTALRELSQTLNMPALEGRLAVLEARSKDLSTYLEAEGASAQFSTSFGRRFTYYDGFVFELFSKTSTGSQARPVAAGGRYDTLLGRLSGGAVEATAIGGVVIPHRLSASMEVPS